MDAYPEGVVKGDHAESVVKCAAFEAHSLEQLPANQEAGMGIC